MPMLNRPLTPEEVQQIMGQKYLHVSSMWEALVGPHYQEVRYRGALDRVDYERPSIFTGLGPTSPSDCIWMVPCGIGALEV